MAAAEPHQARSGLGAALLHALHAATAGAVPAQAAAVGSSHGGVWLWSNGKQRLITTDAAAAFAMSPAVLLPSLLLQPGGTLHHPSHVRCAMLPVPCDMLAAPHTPPTSQQQRCREHCCSSQSPCSLLAPSTSLAPLPQASTRLRNTEFVYPIAVGTIAFALGKKVCTAASTGPVSTAGFQVHT